MSYAQYSQVYFAISLDSKRKCKIGETTNASRRNSQLCQDNYYIILVEDIDGGKSARLFVECYLRECFNSTQKVQQIHTDYFECQTIDTVNWLADRFPIWVEEARAILHQIHAREQVAVQAYSQPCPPQHEKLFNTITYSLQQRGFWRESWQMTTEKENALIYAMKAYFTPLGYTCNSVRNYSWARFEIIKVFQKKGLTKPLFYVILLLESEVNKNV